MSRIALYRAANPCAQLHCEAQSFFTEQLNSSGSVPISKKYEKDVGPDEPQPLARQFALFRTLQLRVASSKRMDCPAGILVSVSVQDIQEMTERFPSAGQSGLEMLRSDQSLTDLPAPPHNAVAAPPRPAIQGLPLLSAESSATLDRQRGQADQIISKSLRQPSEEKQTRAASTPDAAFAETLPPAC